MADQPAGLAHQILEQAPLRGGEPYDDPVAGHTARRNIDGQRAGLDDREVRAGTTARGPNAREQLAAPKGLVT